MNMHLAILISAIMLAAPVRADRMLHDFEGDLEAMKLSSNDVEVKVVPGKKGKALRIESGHEADWPGINWAPAEGKWDLSGYAGIAVDVANVGENDVKIGLRIDNEGGDGSKNCNQRTYEIKRGEARTLELRFVRRMDSGLKLFAMRGYPGNLHTGPASIDPSRIIRMFVFVPHPDKNHAFTIDSIRAYGKYRAGAEMDPEGFFPFIDEFGQYIHKKWPGKTRSVKQMHSRLAKETKDIKRNPGPKSWDKYGGWLEGPKLEATGYFYPKKYEGKWWLVDPEGRLFFSHGIDCVGIWQDTPIDERETWFRDFPGDDDRFKEFWGESRPLHDYYSGRKVRIFNWAGANALRKYGEDWREKCGERAHARLRSWGMNTVGNWSDSNIYRMKRTPYVVAIHHRGTVIEGSEGYWAQFRDVFAPDFEENLRKALEWHKTATAGDPYLIGYFIDNEISWGNKTALAVATLVSPADQPAKKVFIEDLKKKYSSIGKLNRAWGTEHASWKALLESREAPDKDKAAEDLEAFTDRIADAYFRKCRAAVKEIAPDNLYMGPRFAWVNDLAFNAAAKHCDVVSYNLYRRDVSGFKLPGGADYPVIIGEWHAGALDRGMFMPGLQLVESQKARGEFYRNYATGAIRNPLFVGCHWFQYQDQSTIGRSLDGENYQIGFVDICDTPYPETIAAARDVGYRLYETRSEK